MKTGRGIPPWHLWGNSQVIACSDTIVQSNAGNEGQLIRIAYGRPETWQFLFAARLLEGTQAPADTGNTVNVQFDLTTGIGRSQIIIPAFELYRFAWGRAGSAQNAPIGSMKWSSQSLGMRRLDPAFPATPVSDPDDWDADGRSLSNPVTEIVGQDIQLRCIVTAASLTSVTAKVEVSAQFAPRTHVRPEWWLDTFPGGEAGGS